MCKNRQGRGGGKKMIGRGYEKVVDGGEGKGE